jgi:hypothetical protein
MANTHTPGPWIVTNLTDVFTPDRRGNPLDGHQIADCSVDYDIDEDRGLSLEERRANAVLIAAAPDLLVALLAIYDRHNATTMRQARDAISKATGVEQ